MNTTTALSMLDGLIARDIHPLSNLANAAALIWQALPDINWAGFYLLHEGSLWLAPFQGKPACTQIALDRGVCGAAFSQNQTLVVPDVHAFPGHIACDSASRSEIVVPLRFEGRPVGVLDVDSPELARFSDADLVFLEAAAAIVGERCDFGGMRYSL